MGEARQKALNVLAFLREAIKSFDDPEVQEVLQFAAERAKTDPETRQALERIRMAEAVLREADISGRAP